MLTNVTKKTIFEFHKQKLFLYKCGYKDYITRVVNNKEIKV